MRSFQLSVFAMFALAGVMAPAAMAQAATPAASPAASKIGVINFQRAVIESAEFQKAFNDLQAKFQPRQAAVQKAQQELQDIDTQLRASEGKLSNSGAAELQARGQRKQTEVDRLTEDLQADFNAQRDDALRLTSTRMAEVLKKLADEQGLDVIVDTSTGVVPYFRDGLEITDAAIAAYNAAYPAK